MTVTVTNLEKSLEIGNQFDAIIGLLDKRAKQWQENALAKIPNRKMFWFDDTVPPFHDHPTEKDMQGIVDHIRENDLTNPSKKVLVHCFAGISRSTATAIALLIMRGSTIEQAFEQIHIQRTHMWPNEEVLKHFDKILGLDGELTKFCIKWKHNQINNPYDNTPYKLFDLARTPEE